MTATPKKRRNQNRNKPKDSPLMQEYRRAIHASGSAGMTVAEIMAVFGVSDKSVNFRTQFLFSIGQIVWRNARAGGKGAKRRWFAPEFAPSLVAAPARQPRSKAVTLQADAPMVTPDGVKITRAAPFVDRRFAVDNPQRGWINAAECRPWAAGVAR